MKLCAAIIASVRREMFTGGINLLRASCLWIGTTNWIPEGIGVVPRPIVHLVAGFVKYLPPDMSGRLATTSEKANSSPCDAATLARIVICGES